MAAEKLDIQFGYCSESGVITYVGKSLSAANIVVTLNDGSVDTLTSMAEIGIDSGSGSKPRAGYIDNGSFSGLSRFTTYTWSATQGANTITGSFLTNPSDTDDFCMWAKTCEQSGHTIHMWNVVKDYQESEGALPCAGFIHPDDNGYWDSSLPNGTTLAYQSTITSGNKIKVFDYAISAFNDAGLYDGDSFATYGQDQERLWGRRNINLLPSWGDHDAGLNEMGWNVDPAVAELTRFTNSSVVWDAVMQPLSPPTIAGAVANGDKSWSGTVGCLEIMALDGISKGSGDGNWPTAIKAPTVVYGNQQIDNFLDAVEASTQPFKLMPMNYSIKYNDVRSSADASLSELANNPLKDFRLDEFARLFTESGNAKKSLMDNPKTNGLRGHLATLHGDAHVASCVMHKGAAYTDNLPESWLSVSLCGFTDKGGQPLNTDIVNGYIYDGSEVKYVDKAGEYDSFCCRIEVYGSKALREIHFVYLGSKAGGEGVELWTEKLVEKRGMNETHAISADLEIKASMQDTSDL